jgi:hypothetical protein
MLEQRAMFSGNTFQAIAGAPDGPIYSIPLIGPMPSIPGDLRAAVCEANRDSGTGTDTIQLSAGTYTLTQGELDLTNTDHTIIIEGTGSTGPNATIIDQTAIDRVFQVEPGVTVIFKNLEITGGQANTAISESLGDAEGGGILSDGGNVTLDDVLVDHNEARASSIDGSAWGGGIACFGGYGPSGGLEGSLTIENGSRITNNMAIAGQGDTLGGGTGGSARGGGISEEALNALNISDTTITDNSAIAGGGGTVNANDGATGGTALGGGLELVNNDSVVGVLNDDTIAGNVAQGGIGGDGDTDAYGGLGGNAYGGGIYTLDGPVLISGTTISSNSAIAGAGGFNGDGSGQQSPGGSAYGGGAELGNGLNAAGTQLLNDTIDANTARGGFGEGSFGHAGGIDDQTAGLTIVNCTITRNSATSIISDGISWGFGGGLSDYNGTTPDPNLQVQNSIIAGNTANSSPDVDVVDVKSDHNLIGDGDGSWGFSAANGDLIGTDAAPINPMLGTPKLNGGNTITIAPLPGSLAIGAGDPQAAVNASLTTDQRGAGFSRFGANGSVDIGAIQTQSAPIGLWVNLDQNSATGGSNAASKTSSATPAATTANIPVAAFSLQSLADMDAAGSNGNGNGTPLVGTPLSDPGNVTITNSIVSQNRQFYEVFNPELLMP